ncbi:hypothetical protein U732_2679 [Clostridium argentinense CDC 2741]|uniref:Uncharacterized protein n=1 Tax=Clostridium argentinense CDC 2741 TaxID=1418104 RepID=A0A0C1R4M5_9CLOT|nr:hypothetical protein [Clostridium argentinense]HAG45007.1 hypothetical protein [Clostridium sp.]ARC86764.1 hypothetical protein RSJ17_20850 [Clostridium argentinense]KIE45456.1 hypothetical protein U732_2679 [Clostridium argentinense CDC 2741]NFF38510.1 hypothetical protein [Clostridium argentinense]NFP49297.1 hypothetical protein [Clostridium argentinense]
MSNIILCIVVLSITSITTITILAIFCYKQENVKMLMKNKNDIRSDKILSDFIFKIDKKNSK